MGLEKIKYRVIWRLECGGWEMIECGSLYIKK